MKIGIVLPKKYRLFQDIAAGITVGFIMIPQAMAFALLAGVPPIYGLYGCFIPVIVFAFFASSPFLSIGPVSVISIFILQQVQPFAEPFSDEFVSWVLLLGFMVGIIQVGLGIFKGAKYIEMLPKEIISGFIHAAVIIIVFSQLGAITTLTFSREMNYLQMIMTLMNQFEQIHLFSVFLFFISIVLLFGIKFKFKRFPMALTLLLITGFMAYAGRWETKGVQLIGAIPNGLPKLTFFDLSVDRWIALLPTALGLSFLASVGSFIMGKAFAEEQVTSYNPNQEVIALGISKMIGVFFGALVPVGSFNRTLLNKASGAQTQIAALVAASIVGLTLLFLTPYVYYLPMPVIAAVIVFSVLFLLDIPYVKNLWKEDKGKLTGFSLTLLATLFIGFTEGILIGFLFSFVLKRTQARI